MNPSVPVGYNQETYPARFVGGCGRAGCVRWIMTTLFMGVGANVVDCRRGRKRTHGIRRMLSYV